MKLDSVIDQTRFFLNALDLSIPEFQPLPELALAGRLEQAEHIFAAYVRKSLRPDMYFQIPYYDRENRWTYSGETDEAAADRILRHELISCGFPHQFGKEIDWTANPTYNGYQEWTWQLNRHHEWRLLGKRYRETGDERFAKCAADFLSSWVQNAPLTDQALCENSPCWRTIEAGIRMTKNWHYMLHACYRSSFFTDRIIAQFFQSIWEHAYLLKNYHKTGNWLIMEMAGLAHIGILYPFFREASMWKQYAFDMLCQQLHVQIYPDGFQYELSTNYHQVVINNYRWVAEIACAMGQEPPKQFRDGLEKMYDLYPQIVTPDGTLPDLNDGSSLSIRAWMEPAIRLFPKRKDFLWLQSGGVKGARPKFDSVVMPYSGITVFRTGWNTSDIWALFEAAPFGKAHQHEDKLSFLLYAYGKHMLRDAGNFDYDTSEMRKYVLSTRSHNTVRVDGQDQNRRDRYEWHTEDIAKTASIQACVGGSCEVAQGEYNEGYGKEHLSVTHHRKVIFIKDIVQPLFIIDDRLTPADSAVHTYEILWHLEDVEYIATEYGIVADYGDGVALEIVGNSRTSVIKGQKVPDYQGWKPVQIPGEHEHQPIPTVQFQSVGAGQLHAITVLYPFKGPKEFNISILDRIVLLSGQRETIVIDTDKNTITKSRS